MGKILPTRTTTTPISTSKPKPVDHSYINKLPTFAERGKAIYNRLDEIKSNPAYRALPAEKQAKVRANFYDKYVVPSYAGFQHPAPGRDLWVSESAKVNSIRDHDVTTPNKQQSFKDSFGNDKRKEFGQDLAVGAQKAFAGVAMFGLKVTDKALMQLSNLHSYFNHPQGTYDPVKAAVLGPEKNAYEQTRLHRQLSNRIANANAQIQSADYWTQTHPRDTFIGSLGSMTGEALVTLPLYEAMGTESLLSSGAKNVLAGAPSVGGALTTRLAASPVGKFVAKRLVNAADGFLATFVASGGSTKQGVEAGAQFATMGAATEGAGKVIKVASAPVIKKYYANLVAMGGKPFAYESAKSAYSEMQPVEWWLKHGKEAGIDTYKNAHELGHGIMIYPKSETEGHLVLGDRVLPYEGPQQRQILYNTLVKSAERRRQVQDFVLHTTQEAHKGAIDSISMSLYGKPLAEITENQHTEVLTRQAELIEEAASEAPAHLPDLTHAEVEHDLEKVRKETPSLNAFMSADEQHFGVKYADGVTADVIENTQTQTGIKNAPAATKKIAKRTKEVEKATRGEAISPLKYASLNSDTMAYFRAPQNRKALVANLSDRSDKAFDDFYSELKKADRGDLRFEKPEQRLLHHYYLAKDMEDGLKQKFRDRILRQMSKIQGYDKLSGAQLRKAVTMEAQHMQNHIHNVMELGNFYNGDNIYASGNANRVKGRISFTKWQSQARSEVTKAYVSGIRSSLRQHPKALRGFNVAFNKLKGAMDASISDPFEFAKYQQALEDVASIYTKKSGSSKINIQ